MNNEKFTQALAEIVGDERVLRDEPLKNHTTFGIGGPADIFVRPEQVAQVASLIDRCKNEDVPYRILGYGSNLLVSDEGVRGVVIQLADNLSAAAASNTGTVLAQAGASNRGVAELAQRSGLAGYEFAEGIPGGIGGAAVMNAGAYGGMFSDVAVAITCLTKEGEVKLIPAKAAEWGYRTSKIKEDEMIVLAAELQLKEDDPEAILSRMEDYSKRRQEKQPLDMMSAGSTFKRPEGHYAGKLIQDSGMQGETVGGAQVSNLHAGIIVNTGSATAQDVLDLIKKVQSRVFEFSGVMLEPEVCMWGLEQ